MGGPAQIGTARHGRVLSLVIDNPEQRNALRPEFSQALARELRLASDDDSVGAVVLSGAGAHFCAGGDLRTLYETRTSARSPSSPPSRATPRARVSRSRSPAT